MPFEAKLIRRRLVSHAFHSLLSAPVSRYQVDTVGDFPLHPRIGSALYWYEFSRLKVDWYLPTSNSKAL
jgi:hypothetical protein